MQPAIKDHYEIEIPNDKAATYKVVTFIIALINIAAFGYIYFYETNQSRLRFAVLGAVLSMTAFVFYIIKNKTKNLQTFRIEIAFILLALIWFMCGDFWLGLPMLVFGILGIYSNRRPVIRFNADGIVYPSFPARLFKWVEVEFVILKDRVLTMEIEGNRVFQFSLTKEATEKLDEARFNDFCSARVTTKDKGLI